jgi:quercetin dioxygenase-like cupin family protein
MKIIATAGSAVLLASAVQPIESGGQVNASQTVFRAGSQQAAKDESFTGNVCVEPLFASEEPTQYLGAYVTFEPGPRSAWHTHPAGQHLIVTHGLEFTQEWVARSWNSVQAT